MTDARVGFESIVEPRTRHPSSHALPRIGGSPRVLRLRGDASLRDMLRTEENGRRSIVVPSREPVEVGEQVRVEISFGPMFDEVTLTGGVARVTPREVKAPLLLIGLAPGDEFRLRYIEDVIEGKCTPRARGHRRVPADLPVRWNWGMMSRSSRIADLSRGGAFISSSFLPEVGARVELELVLRPGDDPVRLQSRVAWVSKSQRSGFGVDFRLQNREVATRLDTAIRSYDR